MMVDTPQRIQGHVHVAKLVRRSQPPIIVEELQRQPLRHKVVEAAFELQNLIPLGVQRLVHGL